MKLKDLPEELNDKVGALRNVAYGIQLAHSQYLEAIEKFKDAYELIPEPKLSWILGGVTAVDIAQSYYLQAMYREKDEKKCYDLLLTALEYLQSVMSVPDYIGELRLHLIIGELRYEMGNLEKAKDEFIWVYMAVGEDGFEGKNAKYFELIKQII